MCDGFMGQKVKGGVIGSGMQAFHWSVAGQHGFTLMFQWPLYSILNTDRYVGTISCFLTQDENK